MVNVKFFVLMINNYYHLNVQYKTVNNNCVTIAKKNVTIDVLFVERTLLK